VAHLGECCELVAPQFSSCRGDRQDAGNLAVVGAEGDQDGEQVEFCRGKGGSLQDGAMGGAWLFAASGAGEALEGEETGEG
jgi:hypothetical protein